MKCPNCGKPLKEGLLYCEHCGCEIEIVSDIDMELEMNKTIRDIAHKEFNNKNDIANAEFDDDDNPSLIGFLLKRSKHIGKFVYVLIAVGIIAVIAIAVHMGLKISHESSLEYQVEMADKSYSSGDINKAVKYLEKASKIEPSNINYKLKIADYYLELNKPDDAAYTLTEIAENKDTDEAKRVMAYRKLFDLYKEKGDYASIGEKLRNCEIESVLKDYSSYIVSVPKFSTDPGTYNDTINLRITTDSECRILYTLDGSDPITNGIEYTGPLLLEYGSYSVKAVCLNDYDIPGETISGNYLIDVAFSFSPKVEPEDGEFEHTFLIEVEVPVMYTCYYTIDGAAPTKESYKYSNPIPAMEGKHNYKFVVFSNDGTQSEIAEREYTVTLNTDLTAADAVTLLNQGLIDRGYLDESGRHREGVEGTYIFMYSTIYPIKDMGDFYFVVEYIQDDFGNNKMTGTYYAIDCYNGMLYTVDITGEDGYRLSPL